MGFYSRLNGFGEEITAGGVVCPTGQRFDDNPANESYGKCVWSMAPPGGVAYQAPTGRSTTNLDQTRGSYLNVLLAPPAAPAPKFRPPPPVEAPPPPVETHSLPIDRFPVTISNGYLPPAGVPYSSPDEEGGVPWVPIGLGVGVLVLVGVFLKGRR